VTTVLLTLGRLPKALDLARGFSRAGCRVLVAEPFGRTLTGASRHVAREFGVPPPSAGKASYLAAIAKIVKDEDVALVVPVSEETMHVAFARDLFDPRVRLFTMPSDQVIALHDKAEFVRVAQAIGLGVPETHTLGTGGAQALAQTGDVVVKPVFSCSGRGMHIVRSGSDLPPADPATPVIVQRFVEGQEYSSCTIARDGRVVATMVYRGTVMAGSVAISFERVEHPAISGWIDTFVNASGWTGFIAFDFIVDAAGTVRAIECNPRATSGLHFWEAEDIARAVLNPADTAPVRVRPQRQLQQFYACLTEAQLAMFRRRGFKEQLKRLFSTRDVTWDTSDPWPFLSMMFTSWPIMRMAMAERVPFGEVATRDVDWYPGGAP
jgi:predicted ATP-grasp superfamily ATP-dependent carboligase